MRAWGQRAVRLGAAVAGLGLVGGLGAHLLGQPGVYAGRVNAVVVPPTVSDVRVADNPLDARISTTVDFAGLVAKEVGQVADSKVTVSKQITLLDLGVTDGWSVRQPSDGGQWNYIFDEPAIEVQATGPTPERVTEQIAHVMGRISDTITAREDAAEVETANRVTVIASPPMPVVTYSEGSRGRAKLALAIAACLAAWGAHRAAGHLLARRAGRLGGRTSSSYGAEPTGARGEGLLEPSGRSEVR